MSREVSLQRLEQALNAARAGLFIQAALEAFVRWATWILCPAILLVASSQYWFDGRWSSLILAAVLLCILGIPMSTAAWRVAAPFRAAFAIDVRTHLKDRLSSAWEFLHEGTLDEPRRAQIEDAVAHAEALDASHVLNPAVLRRAKTPLALAIFFGLAFLVPARGSVPPDAGALALHAAQLELLRDFRDSLEADRPDAEHEEVLEKLRQIEERFAEGKMSDRDVMIALSRLEQELDRAMAQSGVAGLARELEAVAPHLAADASAHKIGEAMQRRDLKQAAKEMNELADRVNSEALSHEEKLNLASAMQTATDALSQSDARPSDTSSSAAQDATGDRSERLASESGMEREPTTAGGQFLENGDQQERTTNQGRQNQGSMRQDLQEGANALRNADAQGFDSASESMAGKLQRLQQFLDSQSMREQFALCRAGLGQCEGQQPGPGAPRDGAGNTSQPGDGGGQGGLEAGSTPAGDNRRDPSRLYANDKEILKVSGMAGAGVVRTQAETIEGATSASGRTAKEVHSEYEAVAEEVIEREAVPLSHRLHVKRYFQGIRPQE